MPQIKEKLPMGKHPAYFTNLVHFCTIVALVGVMRKISYGFFLHYSLHYILITLAWLKIVFRTHTQKVQKKKKTNGLTNSSKRVIFTERIEKRFITIFNTISIDW